VTSSAGLGSARVGYLDVATEANKTLVIADATGR